MSNSVSTKLGQSTAAGSERLQPKGRDWVKRDTKERADVTDPGEREMLHSIHARHVIVHHDRIIRCRQMQFCTSD